MVHPQCLAHKPGVTALQPPLAPAAERRRALGQKGRELWGRKVTIIPLQERFLYPTLIRRYSRRVLRARGSGAAAAAPGSLRPPGLRGSPAAALAPSPTRSCPAQPRCCRGEPGAGAVGAPAQPRRRRCLPGAAQPGPAPGAASPGSCAAAGVPIPPGSGCGGWKSLGWAPLGLTARFLKLWEQPGCCGSSMAEGLPHTSSPKTERVVLSTPQWNRKDQTGKESSPLTCTSWA